MAKRLYREVTEREILAVAFHIAAGCRPGAIEALVGLSARGVQYAINHATYPAALERMERIVANLKRGIQ